MSSVSLFPGRIPSVLIDFGKVDGPIIEPGFYLKQQLSLAFHSQYKWLGFTGTLASKAQMT